MIKNVDITKEVMVVLEAQALAENKLRDMLEDAIPAYLDFYDTGMTYSRFSLEILLAFDTTSIPNIVEVSFRIDSRSPIMLQEILDEIQIQIRRFGDEEIDAYIQNHDKIRK